MSELDTTQRREGDQAFPTKENDNSSESSTDKTNVDQTQSSDENKETDVNKNDDKRDEIAFHPRWKEREEDWKKRFNDSEVRHTSELQRLREDFEARFPKQENRVPTTIPSWFGGDESQWRDYQDYEKQRVSNLREETLKEFHARSEAEQKKLDEATDFMNQEISTIESDKEINPEGQKVDRNKMLKFVLDNELVDTKGRWNYKAAFKMMNPKDVFKAKEALDQKRKLASATNSENRPETKPSNFVTSEDFKKNPSKRPW